MMLEEPVAVNDTAETGEDIAVMLDILANDTDTDGDMPLIISLLEFEWVETTTLGEIN